MSLVDEVRMDRSLPLPPPRQAHAIRLAADATVRQVAGELGVSPATVTRWEAGRCVPRRRHRRAYAELLAQLRAVVSE